MTAKKQTQRKRITADVWMADNGELRVKVKGEPVAHITSDGRTNLYGRLVAALIDQGCALRLAAAANLSLEMAGSLPRTRSRPHGRLEKALKGKGASLRVRGNP